MTQILAKTNLDFSVITNQEDLVAMDGLSGLLLVIKLPLDDDIGETMPDFYLVEDEVEAFPVTFDSNCIRWESRTKGLIELDLNRTPLTQGELETDWFVVALSSKTGEIIKQGVLVFK